MAAQSQNLLTPTHTDFWVIKDVLVGTWLDFVLWVPACVESQEVIGNENVSHQYYLPCDPVDWHPSGLSMELAGKK